LPKNGLEAALSAQICSLSENVVDDCFEITTGACQAEASPAATREAVFDGAVVEAAVWRGAPAPGARIEGPAVCELPESTLVIPPGWSGEVDPTSAIRLEPAP